jgi:23S rRNA pseudouridine955/2504/2580 synthase
MTQLGFDPSASDATPDRGEPAAPRAAKKQAAKAHAKQFRKERRGERRKRGGSPTVPKGKGKR